MIVYINEIFIQSKFSIQNNFEAVKGEKSPLVFGLRFHTIFFKSACLELKGLKTPNF